MHPGVFAWWNARRHAGCGASACGGGLGHEDAGPWGWHAAPHGGGHGGDDVGGGGLGVRRPLRFLAYKLDLEDAQTTELAAILSELKTERAQASVDHRRTTAAFAAAVASETFDESKAKAASDERVKSTERVEGAVARALGRIHALLSPDQRAKLAYLLRTGALSI